MIYQNNMILKFFFFIFLLKIKISTLNKNKENFNHLINFLKNSNSKILLAALNTNLNDIFFLEELRYRNVMELALLYSFATFIFLKKIIKSEFLLIFNFLIKKMNNPYTLLYSVLINYFVKKNSFYNKYLKYILYSG